jgi:hypothetical protein
MEHRDPHQCPMCGSLMGAEAQPAAMRKRAEILDQLDKLERRLRDAESGTWRLTAVEVVCGPCRETLVGVDIEGGDAMLAPLRARLRALRDALAAALQRPT